MFIKRRAAMAQGIPRCSVMAARRILRFRSRIIMGTACPGRGAAGVHTPYEVGWLPEQLPQDLVPNSQRVLNEVRSTAECIHQFHCLVERYVEVLGVQGGCAVQRDGVRPTSEEAGRQVHRLFKTKLGLCLILKFE